MNNTSLKSRVPCTQFKRDNKVYLHPTLGYEEGAQVKVVSECGEVVLEVVLSEDVRHNCLVVPSNTVGVNMLTPSLVSNEGESACYQEVKVTVEKVEG